MDRPIIFSAPMVRALLAGTKTQTRRAVKPQPPEWVKVWNGCNGLEHFFFDREEDDEGGKHWPSYEHGLRCPYGQPGDRLWVREAWTTHKFMDAIPPRDLQTTSIAYVADGKIETGKYRQAFHMPRRYSRITLEITGVRVERLGQCSESDAVAEGSFSWAGEQDTPVRDLPEARLVYRQLWEQINGPGSWDANPLVWVVEFRRITP